VENGESFREFSRELILRFERLARELRADNERMRDENRRYFEALDARTADLHAESVAHTSALLAVLDRLGGASGPAPAS
jgi:hypothetical protein